MLGPLHGRERGARRTAALQSNTAIRLCPPFQARDGPVAGPRAKRASNGSAAIKGCRFVIPDAGGGRFDMGGTTTRGDKEAGEKDRARRTLMMMSRCHRQLQLRDVAVTEAGRIQRGAWPCLETKGVQSRDGRFGEGRWRRYTFGMANSRE